jgi:hypothetical protein
MFALLETFLEHALAVLRVRNAKEASACGRGPATDTINARAGERRDLAALQ